MRTLAATLIIGAAIAGAMSLVVTGFPAGFAVGVAYMLIASITINTRAARS
jgi:hypothetical protein